MSADKLRRIATVIGNTVEWLDPDLILGKVSDILAEPEPEPAWVERPDKPGAWWFVDWYDGGWTVPVAFSVRTATHVQWHGRRYIYIGPVPQPPKVTP